MKVSRAQGPYSLLGVMLDEHRMYLFEDNPQRTAEKDFHREVPKVSWYYIKYQQDDNTLYRGSERHGISSCIRGLVNAYPLCTVGNMYGRFWSDDDLDEFSEFLESDIYDIIRDAPRFTEVIVPWQGIFKTEESGITENRCPKIYQYLRERTEYLWWLLKLV